MVTFHSSVAFIDTLQTDLRFTTELHATRVYNSQFGSLTDTKNVSSFHAFLDTGTNFKTYCPPAFTTNDECCADV